MQFAHNGYYKGSNPLGLNLNCYILFYNIFFSPKLIEKWKYKIIKRGLKF